MSAAESAKYAVNSQASPPQTERAAVAVTQFMRRRAMASHSALFPPHLGLDFQAVL